MIPETLVFLVLLFIIAALYSSVGHGGASGYLALMGLFHFAPDTMRSSALLLNIFVSAMAWWQYSRSVHLNKKLMLWLVVGSIPAAFLGALIYIDASIYKKLLGVLLLLPAARLLGWLPTRTQTTSHPAFFPAVTFGIGIGLLSGIIGIGGGIILSPLLILLGWADIKQTALISSIFIFLNSLAGMGGVLVNGIVINTEVYLWILIAVTGGILGSWLGSTKFTTQTLKYTLGLVLIIAGVKLLAF